MSETWTLYATFPNMEDARKIVRSLIEAKLIACANLHNNVESLYRWQGEVQQEKEVVMIAKTSAVKVDAAIAAIKKFHSYELPCIVASPVAKGLPAFLQWVETESS